MSEVNWQEVARRIKAEAKQKRTEIHIDDVREWFGLSSTNTAAYYLEKLERMGIVVKEAKGTYSKWYLA